MNLEMLLEEQQSVKGKIGDALGKLKGWFQSKLEEAQGIFESIKAKVLAKLGKSNVPPESKSKVKSKLVEIKAKCSGVISDCKGGISAVSKGDAQEASNRKQKVLTGLKVTAGLVTAIGGIIAGKAAYDNREELAGKAKQAAGKAKQAAGAVKDKAEQAVADRITKNSRKANEERESKNEETDFDFEALMEEINSLDHETEEVLEEDFDTEALMEEIECIGLEEEVEEDFDTEALMEEIAAIGEEILEEDFDIEDLTLDI